MHSHQPETNQICMRRVHFRSYTTRHVAVGLFGLDMQSGHRHSAFFFLLGSTLLGSTLALLIVECLVQCGPKNAIEFQPQNFLPQYVSEEVCFGLRDGGALLIRARQYVAPQDTRTAHYFSWPDILVLTSIKMNIPGSRGGIF